MGRPGQLKRPALADGPLKVLNDALHELHLKAGWPSLTEMLRANPGGPSRSSLHGAFTGPVLPRRDTVDALVGLLAGRARGVDTEGEFDRFDALWQAAALVEAVSVAPEDAKAEAGPDQNRGFVPRLPQVVAAVDLVRFSALPNSVQLAAHANLLSVASAALAQCGIDRSSAVVEDRGDGCLIIFDPSVDPTLLSTHWVEQFRRQLNMVSASLAQPLRVRLSLVRGDVIRGEHSTFGAAVIAASRLVDSAPLRDMSLDPNSVVVVAIADDIYARTDAAGPADGLTGYVRVTVAFKDSALMVWLRAFNSSDS